MKDKTTFNRACAAAFLSVSLALAWGCEQGAEGDRCNPDLSHDECNAGLTCQQPPDCPENYCCPTTGTGTNPFCQSGCNGGLASICAADPTYDACVTDASADSAQTGDSGPIDSGAGADTGNEGDSAKSDAHDGAAKD